MLKVTIDNVTKLAEDALYIQLADLKESDPMYDLIEAELDRRAELYNARLAKQRQDQMDSLQLTQAIQAEIHAIFEGYKGKKTLILIEHLGQEFIEDYKVCEVTFTVTSLVSHRSWSLNSNSTWSFDNIIQARRKVANLIYDRVYDKFMRDPSKDSLELLKRVLG